MYHARTVAEPLTPAVFHILLALADADRHGYGIAQEVAARTGGQVRLGPGTLYGTLTRLLDVGLVEDCSSPRKTDPSDERRRYYHLTARGRQMARTEARRLADLVSLARDKALIPGR